VRAPDAATLIVAFALAVSPICAALQSATQQSAQPAAPEADPWNAPDVYRIPSDGVVSPLLLRDVKANYTADAMRARISGVVGLECIVERDGTVGAVRIVRSLDPVNGLDDEAVKTLKKWRFRPAMKEEVAVRSRVSVEMSFTLRMTAPKLEWPDMFSARPSDHANAPERWSEQVITAAEFQLTIRYPREWTVPKSLPPRMIFAIQRDDGRGPRGFAVAQPIPAAREIATAMSDDALRSLAARVSQQVANGSNAFELLKFGQIRTPDRLWFWVEMSRALDSGRSADAPPVADKMRLWVFTTTERGQQIGAFCSVLIPVGTSEADTKDLLERTGADFAEILTRISFRPGP
jgi:TonB family protein